MSQRRFGMVAATATLAATLGYGQESATTPITPPLLAIPSEVTELPESTIRATPAPAPAPAAPEPPTEATTAQDGPFATGGAFDYSVQGPFMSDVQGTKIYVGKGTYEIDLSREPPISNNNYRQAFITVPGLLVSEESTPLVSFGYRGLNPDRAQFMQVMKDGFPIAADYFGYPESYYTPVLQTVDHIDFIRGGSALLYGPQPGGALNYVTKMPAVDTPFSIYTQNLFGSHDYFSTYNAMTGTNDRFGYYLYGHHRQTHGFRQANSGFDVNYGGGKLVTELSKSSRLIASFDFYNEEHEEPGGLTRNAFFAGQIRNVSRFFDKFEMARNFGYLTYQEEINDAAFAEVRFWGGYYSRWSRRQNGGGFGTLPTLQTDQVQLQTFNTFGIEPRARFDYELFGSDDLNTLTVGTLFYRNTGGLSNQLGSNPLANAGTNQNQSDRLTNYWSLFAENRFQFGKLNIVPAARFEFINQFVKEDFNSAKTAAGVPLSTDESFDMVPLFGLGIAYEFTETTQAYYNISQAYRPVTFAQSVALNPNTAIVGNLNPSWSYTTEIGLRGQPRDWLYWNVDYFYLDLSNLIGSFSVPQVGLVNTVVTDVGQLVNKGFEYATMVDLIGLYDDVSASDLGDTFGSFSVFSNAMILDAQIISGPFRGNRPQQAPGYLVRSGILYNLPDFGLDDPEYSRRGGYGQQLPYRAQLMFAGTMVDGVWGDDNNSQQRLLPSYDVWDLTLEVKVWRSASVVAGVNNIFNELYSARVTATGIDPSDRRNHYFGFQVGY